VDEMFNDDMLRAISVEWAANKTTDEELSDNVLDESSIESGFDMLTGSSGSDWFIINLSDKITDFKKNNKDGDLVTLN